MTAAATQDRAYDTVIHNGTVVTVDADFTVVPDGLVCVRDGVIRWVGARPPDTPLPKGVETVDARGGLVLPGLVNAHTHLPMSIFRGLADDLPLSVWLNDIIFPAETRHVHPDTVTWGTLLSCAELLLSGTTTCCDGYFLEDHVAAAVKRSGMRAVLGQGVIDFPAPGVADPSGNVDHAVSFVKRWQGVCSLITPSIFCHSPYTCSAQTLCRAKAAARDLGVLFQIHAAETRTETDACRVEHGVSPVAFLDRLGVLDPMTLLVHAVAVDAADIRIMAGRGTSAAHCPESNMKLAAGIAPVPAMIRAGVRMGLGTDGCASNNDLDLFREMDTAAKLHKADTLDPTVMDAATVLRMATMGGAAAIGLDRTIGSIEKGKQADLIIVDARVPALTPMYTPVSQVVYAADGSCVRDVMVAGRFRVRDRVLLSLDTAEIMDRVKTMARTVAGK